MRRLGAEREREGERVDWWVRVEMWRREREIEIDE